MTRRERRKLNITRRSAQHAPVLPEPQQKPAAPAGDSIETPAVEPATLPHHGHSTGPVTPEGKAVSSRNAVRHGLCATKLTGADLEQLHAIRARLDQEWEPSTETENILLQQMALSQWRLERALELELSALDGPLDPAALALALRYRTSAERSFYKALAELQRLRTAMRENALRQARIEKEEESAALRRLEAQILGPIFSPPQFVSQNTPPVSCTTAPPAGGLQPARGFSHAGTLAKPFQNA
jgi:hypothetical protein